MSKIQKLNKETLVLAIDHLRNVDSDFKRILNKRNNQINTFEKVSGFEGLISLIVEQQLSVASAKAIFGRVKLICEDFQPIKFLELHEDKYWFKSSKGLLLQEYSKGNN